MLTADQITALGDRAQRITDPIVEFLIEDIARRVSEAGQLTSTASYQVWRLQQLGMSQQEVQREIRKRLGVSQSQVEQLLTQAAEVGYDFDLSRLPHADAVSFADNEVIQQIVSSGVQMAQDDLSNMVQTLGFVNHDGVSRPLTEAYQQACDFAFQKVAMGAQDYNSAIRQATKGLAERGIVSIDYETGRSTTIEAAVRRNVMSALGTMQEQISQQNHDDLGCDGWEISAHGASAPDHEPIQGKQYTDAKYNALNRSLIRRIGTLNCGHAAFPIILGVNEPQYSAAELEQFRQANEKGVDYEGKHYTMYEATQRQRKLERAIRNRKRRILIDQTTGDGERLAIDQTRLVILNDEYARFSKAAGLRSQRERMNVAGFGAKEMAAVRSTAEDVFKNPPKDLTAVSKKVDKALNQYNLKKSKWSGNTVIRKRDDMVGTSGKKDWNCDVVLREDASVKTAVHEHLHARSVSYYDRSTYILHQKLEEGTVELFAQEICKKNDVAYRGAYPQTVKRLRMIISITKVEDSFDFAKQLFDIPLPKRYNWLRQKADDAILTGSLSEKTVKSLNDAVEYMRGKGVE